MVSDKPPSICELIGDDGTETDDVGIEIEVEFEDTDDNFTIYDTPCPWRSVIDGSLRGGSEFVTDGSVKVDDVKDYVDELSNFIEDRDPIFTHRCSVHVHVNVLDMTLMEALSFATLYWCVQPILVDYVSSARKGNLFCLRLIDTPRTPLNVASMINTSALFDALMNWEETNRYADLNLAALPKLGTLEFRCMEGNLSGDRISEWCRILCYLRDQARGRRPRDIVEGFSSGYGRELLEELAKREPMFNLFWKRVDKREAEEVLLKSMRFAQILAYEIKDDNVNNQPPITTYADPDEIFNDDHHYDDEDYEEEE